MRKAANLPRNLLAVRYAKERKRDRKRQQLRKIPKVTGMATGGGYWGLNRWSGLKPRKLEGFVLSLAGHKITEAIWEKVYPEIPYGTRMRMV